MCSLHGWTGQRIRGRQGLECSSLFFSRVVNVSQQVSGAQTNNRAKASIVRAALQTVNSDKDIMLSNDSKWCIDVI